LNSGSLSCEADVLAGEAARTDAEVVGHSGPLEAEGDTADAGKQMDLMVSGKLIGPDVSDVSLIHIPRRQVASRNLLAQDAAAIWIVVVVVCHHKLYPYTERLITRLMLVSICREV
jgi:hypothetical protein